MNKSVRNIVIGSLVAAASLTVFVFVKKKTTTKKVKILEEKKEIVEKPEKEKVYHLLYEFEKKNSNKEAI